MPVVLITGAGSGMGKLTAELLSQEGYTVYAGMRNSATTDSRGATLKPIYIDVTQTQSINDAVSHIMAQEGAIDVLVNNAGYGLLSTVEDATDEEMFEQFNVNVLGLLKVTRAVLPHMRQARQGVIINISSFLGKMGLPLLTHYNASKYAVEGIVDSLRFETLPYNVRVHAIESGLFSTNFVHKGLVINAKTTAQDSPYKKLVDHFVPLVANAINNGPSAQPIAEAVKKIIEDDTADIFVPVGVEAETFIPLRKSMSDNAFEAKIKETFGV